MQAVEFDQCHYQLPAHVSRQFLPANEFIMHGNPVCETEANIVFTMEVEVL
jgi:hypothetical protein